MFERNKIDNNTQHLTGIPVEITHDDGSVDTGKLLIPASVKLSDILNGPQQFLDFETFEGVRTFLAKYALKSVRVIQVPSAIALPARSRDGELDPYRILGLAPGASWDEIRASYHAVAKVYHPDRYANAELPVEVGEYLSTMSRRINAAFEALEAPHRVRRDLMRHRTDPVYSTPTR